MSFPRFTFLLAAASAAVWAGDPAPKTPPGATVTVSAEAQPVAIARTPAPVRVVEADEIQRLGARTLGDLIAAVEPGAVMPTGSAGSQTSAFLNGTLSRNVIVLLDGLRLNDPTAISPDLGTLSLAGIERVELVLGPASVLYGSDAIGGVISLTSYGRGKEGTHGEVGLKAGTDVLRGGSARIQLTGRPGWISAGAEALRQDNGLPDDLLHQAGGFLRMGTTLGAADLTAFYRNAGQTASLPFSTAGWPAVRTYDPTRETHARQETWGASLRWPLAPSLLLEDTLQTESGSTGDPVDLAPRQQVLRAFRRVEEQLTLTWTPVPAFRLSGRAEGRVDTAHATNYYDPDTYAATPYRGEGHDLAGALEARWTLAEGLDWVAGLRRDGAHRDLTRLDTGVRSRAGSAEAGTWRTGLNWRLAPALRLYASTGQGFRMPNTVEFALNAQAEAQDGRAYPILPERSRTLQMGATGRFAEHWEYRLEAQRTRIESLLAYIYDTSFAFPPLFTSHYANQGAVRAQGIEGALGWRGGGDVAYGWDLSLRSQETRDLEMPQAPFGSGADTAILRHPFFTGAFSAFLQSEDWRADLRFAHVGPRYDLSDTTYAVIAPGKPYRDLAVGLSRTLGRSVTVALRGEHLLQPRQSVPDWLTGRYDGNGDAALVYGFPAPFPRWTLSATWTF
jgi:outer membrane receptor protein involved in Fe transport